ncbi:hypothetical protein N9T54_00695 [Alphaproteobacteria bacterium]|nr:hypothetical protein [Alphaproteobacteria bacterium]
MIKFKNKGSFKVLSDKQFVAWIKKTLPDYPTIFDYGCGYEGWTNLISSLKYSQVDVDDVDELFRGLKVSSRIVKNKLFFSTIFYYLSESE